MLHQGDAVGSGVAVGAMGPSLKPIKPIKLFKLFGRSYCTQTITL
jgi:hypothetical protein